MGSHSPHLKRPHKPYISATHNCWNITHKPYRYSTDCKPCLSLIRTWKTLQISYTSHGLQTMSATHPHLEDHSHVTYNGQPHLSSETPWACHIQYRIGATFATPPHLNTTHVSHTVWDRSHVCQHLKHHSCVTQYEIGASLPLTHTWNTTHVSQYGKHHEHVTYSTG